MFLPAWTLTVSFCRTVAQRRGLARRGRKDPPNGGDERLPDDGNAQRLAAFLDELGPLVVYFGKLMEEKGVQVLLEAMRANRCPAGCRRVRAVPL